LETLFQKTLDTFKFFTLNFIWVTVTDFLFFIYWDRVLRRRDSSPWEAGRPARGRVEYCGGGGTAATVEAVAAKLASW
jgi:hypothetical protein